MPFFQRSDAWSCTFTACYGNGAYQQVLINMQFQANQVAAMQKLPPALAVLPNGIVDSDTLALILALATTNPDAFALFNRTGQFTGFSLPFLVANAPMVSQILMSLGADPAFFRSMTEQSVFRNPAAVQQQISQMTPPPMTAVDPNPTPPPAGPTMAVTPAAMPVALPNPVPASAETAKVGLAVVGAGLLAAMGALVFKHVHS